MQPGFVLPCHFVLHATISILQNAVSFVVDCMQQLLRILNLYQGLARDTVEQSLVQLKTADIRIRSNGEEATLARQEVESVRNTMVNVRISSLTIISAFDVVGWVVMSVFKHYLLLSTFSQIPFCSKSKVLRLEKGPSRRGTTR